MDQLQQIIEKNFERRAEITPRNADAQLKEAVDSVIAQLDQGKLRVAEKVDGQWVTHQWLKKAVLLSFRLEDNAFIKGGFTNYYDKAPSKFADYNSRDFREGGFRVVPPAAARRGRVHRQERGADAFLCEYRGVRRRRHHGGYLGNGRLLRADRQERPSERGGRHRRRAGTGTGQHPHGSLR